MGQGSSRWDVPSPAPSQDSGIGISVKRCALSCFLSHTHTILRLLLNFSTPLPTPTHKYNAWMSGRKSMGITPLAREGGRERGGEKEPMQFGSEAEREEWEEEQKVL